MLFSGNYMLYLCFSLPALLLGIFAQFKVKSNFSKYSLVRTSSGTTGAQTARLMLDQNGLHTVKIELSRGRLSDHYDPSKKVLRLSKDVYYGNSIAAVGIAAHEAGHALQHANRYIPLHIRSFMVPSVRLGSWLGPVVFTIGMMMEYLISNSDLGFQIALIGLILFAVTALFSIVTLPVEINASKRAKKWLVTSAGFNNDEMRGVNHMLDSAALTYVAAAVQAIMSVLYYATILFRRRD